MSREGQRAEPQDKVIVVGRVQGPYGIKGWVHLAAYTDPASNLLDYRPWLVQRSAETAKSGAETANNWRSIDVVEARAHKKGFVARIEGVADRTAAERLKGQWIGVPESQLPEPAVGDYYWKDLVGVEVVGESGVSLGFVSSLIETGAHDVLVVQQQSDPENSDSEMQEVLIPFHPRYVIDVDLAAGKIQVDWQDI
jgi:16S rRNA processing protein RimM